LIHLSFQLLFPFYQAVLLLRLFFSALTVAAFLWLVLFRDVGDAGDVDDDIPDGDIGVDVADVEFGDVVVVAVVAVAVVVVVIAVSGGTVDLSDLGFF